MSQRPEAEQSGSREKEPVQRGIKINFSNSEVLRAYILDLRNSRRPSTLAERMSGIKEISLGEFPLDGQLFRSVNFSLVVEPDPNPRTQVGRPTAIIRADIKLGDIYSKLKDYQYGRVEEKLLGSKEEPEESEDYFLTTLSFEDGGGNMEFVEYSRNTARIHRQKLDKDNWSRSPLVVLQIWDEDTKVDDAISISLFSISRYSEDWSIRYSINSAGKDKLGWEVDPDDTDRWQFINPVGVDVYDAEAFKDAITFYEEAFSQVIRLLYKAEGVDIPNLLHEIESPMIFEKKREITFKDIGGQEEAIKKLRSRIVLMKSGYKTDGKTTPLLLYGLPGNGKTSLTEAMASELGAPLIVKTTQDLPSTANDADFINLLEAGFLEAKAAAKLGGGQSVYCIEQIEALIGNNLRLQDRVLNLMDLWTNDPDGSVLVIATSNFPQNLHPGIVSRFEAISVPHPSEEGRREILEIHRQKINALLGRDIFANVDFDRVARRLDHLSGRDIEKFLKIVYSLARLESQEKGREISISTEFVLNLSPDNRLGFKTS